MTNDVSQAYFYAPVKEGQYIYVQLPKEDMLKVREYFNSPSDFTVNEDT